MVTFAASETGLVVRSGGEVLQVDAWGESGIRVRATLSASVTETPGSALLEDEARTAQVEIGDGRARVSNGDLIVEVIENGEGRFVPFPPLLRRDNNRHPKGSRCGVRTQALRARRRTAKEPAPWPAL